MYYEPGTPVVQLSEIWQQLCKRPLGSLELDEMAAGPVTSNDAFKSLRESTYSYPLPLDIDLDWNWTINGERTRVRVPFPFVVTRLESVFSLASNGIEDEPGLRVEGWVGRNGMHPITAMPGDPLPARLWFSLPLFMDGYEGFHNLERIAPPSNASEQIYAERSRTHST